MFFCLLAVVLILMFVQSNMRLCLDVREEVDTFRGLIVREDKWITENLIKVDKERKKFMRYPVGLLYSTY